MFIQLMPIVVLILVSILSQMMVSPPPFSLYSRPYLPARTHTHTHTMYTITCYSVSEKLFLTILPQVNCFLFTSVVLIVKMIDS